MNIPQIVQMIATAVNAKMTLTLSQRIQQLSERMTGGNNGGNGFFSRVQSRGIGRTLERTEARRDKAGNDFYKSLHESFVAKANQESAATIRRLTERTIRLKDAFDDLSAAAEKLKKDYQEKTRAEQAAEKRHPQTAMKKLWRQAKVQMKRRIGKRGRQSIKKIRDSLDPQKAKSRADAARSVYRQTQESHQIAEKVLKTSQSKYDEAKTQHKTNPTSSTARNLVNAGQGLDAAAVAEKTAKSGMAVARGAMGMAVATEAAALSIPVVGEALLGLQLACATAAAAFGAAASFVVGQSQAMQSEVERFRKERSTYNGVIANAVARYDRQSIQLEARSSMASQSSAKGVVESGMALRESTQGRSERWENLSNHAITFFNDMATTVSRAIDFFDFIPRIGTEMFDALRILVEYASFGNIVMTKIERNTKQEDPIGIDAFKGFFKGVTDKKPPKDLKPVK